MNWIISIIFCIALALFSLKLRQDKENCTYISKGIFLKIDTNRGKDANHTNCYPVVQYEYNGETYKNRSRNHIEYKKLYFLKTGDEIEMYINPDKPHIFIAKVPELTEEQNESFKKLEKVTINFLAPILIIPVITSIIFLFIIFLVLRYYT